ncbi:hypothetical protein F5878DRAFT_537480 [Lentinula raphanica]|uniref:Phosphatidylinositol N-acetylglucosaminyltransferase subunit H conserved domain-containing protein n=1 Tax=Lentinula raphanica TaxID=153919 RepID=A0AA38P972_9AGAR|nr:hypothetical protein F5880DRAFT_1474827 [Lentinula raphanica]KAJ3838450.1 hypothetical protein F5878DRAFT_537480 [Lentinula raphanica]
MQRLQPLQTHPEFSIFHTGSSHEYRVENWHLARNGSGVVIRHATPWSWKYSFIPLMISVSWPKVLSTFTGPLARIILCLAAIFFIWTRCTQVIHESVIVLPEHGIQLETHKGLPPFTLFINRRFVPYTMLRDIVINEGIKRWDIRYYLVALKEGTAGGVALDVCFPSILPHFPILLQVYRDLHEFIAIQQVPSTLSQSHPRKIKL